MLAATLFFAVWRYPFIPRYVLFLQPLYLLFVSRGIVALGSLVAGLAAQHKAASPRAPGEIGWAGIVPALAAAPLLLLLGASLVTTSNGYAQSKPIDWRSLAAYLQTHAQPQDAIASSYSWARTALRWYLDPAVQYAMFYTAELDDPAVLLSGARQVWLIQPAAQPLDQNDDHNPLAQLDLVPEDGWEGSGTRSENDFFPVSESPARLYVGKIATSWIQFAGVPQPNWTDRAYSEIAPDKELYFSLKMPGDAPGELWLTYFDHSQKEIQVSINGQVTGVIGGGGGGWQTAQLPVPAGGGDIVDVTLKAVGGGVAGVSFAELRPATP